MSAEQSKCTNCEGSLEDLLDLFTCESCFLKRCSACMEDECNYCKHSPKDRYEQIEVVRCEDNEAMDGIEHLDGTRIRCPGKNGSGQHEVERTDWTRFGLCQTCLMKSSTKSFVRENNNLKKLKARDIIKENIVRAKNDVLERWEIEQIDSFFTSDMDGEVLFLAIKGVSMAKFPRTWRTKLKSMQDDLTLMKIGYGFSGILIGYMPKKTGGNNYELLGEGHVLEALKSSEDIDRGGKVVSKFNLARDVIESKLTSTYPRQHKTPTLLQSEIASKLLSSLQGLKRLMKPIKNFSLSKKVNDEFDKKIMAALPDFDDENDVENGQFEVHNNVENAQSEVDNNVGNAQFEEHNNVENAQFEVEVDNNVGSAQLEGDNNVGNAQFEEDFNLGNAQFEGDNYSRIVQTDQPDIQVNRSFVSHSPSPVRLLYPINDDPQNVKSDLLNVQIDKRLSPFSIMPSPPTNPQNVSFDQPDVHDNRSTMKLLSPINETEEPSSSKEISITELSQMVVSKKSANSAGRGRKSLSKQPKKVVAGGLKRILPGGEIIIPNKRNPSKNKIVDVITSSAKPTPGGANKFSSGNHAGADFLQSMKPIKEKPILNANKPLKPQEKMNNGKSKNTRTSLRNQSKQNKNEDSTHPLPIFAATKPNSPLLSSNSSGSPSDPDAHKTNERKAKTLLQKNDNRFSESPMPISEKPNKTSKLERTINKNMLFSPPPVKVPRNQKQVTNTKQAIPKKKRD